MENNKAGRPEAVDDIIEPTHTNLSKEGGTDENMDGQPGEVNDIIEQTHTNL